MFIKIIVQTKFVVVLGALMSGMGKGAVVSSIVQILDIRGYKALPLKFDGYLNYDCGTMNPYRHGEVFVLDDKSEVDMDFGTYERFIKKDMTGDLSLTGGKLFSKLIEKERKGGYLGKDVQIIPHLTDEIINYVKGIAKGKKLDVLVIEVGGTVGDIENSYFIEAMRQLSLQEKVIFVALTYVPTMAAVGEQKTKPTQIAFRSIMNTGINPDFLFCRSENEILDNTIEKLSLFTNIKKDYIIDDSDQQSIYYLPLHFEKQNFGNNLINKLNLEEKKVSKSKLDSIKNDVGKILEAKENVKIAVVGKYVELKDAYASIAESVILGGAACNTKTEIKWIESEKLENIKNLDLLKDVKGVIVPGGFGNRGIEGMINAITYARENKIPYLGICLGMQLMAVEFARNVCKLKNANSTEFNPNAKYKIVHLMTSQKNQRYKGATMRLGAWDCKITENNSIAYGAYRKNVISERHRHRYEFNNNYRRLMEKNGLLISGTTPDNMLVEMIEWKESFGIGTQAHPELKSKPGMPAPLFKSFINACKKTK